MLESVIFVPHLFLLFILGSAQAFMMNTDAAFSRWPAKTVPYIFYPGDYSAAEQNLIQTAMTQISSNVGNCIQWVNLGQAGLLSTYPSRNFAIISRNGGPGTPSPTCFSYPGMITQQEGRGQYVAIQAACLENVRNVMRILSYLLGLRPEHNKPNRDSFITVNTAAATPKAVQAGVYTIIPSANRVLLNPNEFDYNSITLVDPLTYSSAGQPVVTSKTATPISNIGQLSIRDCQALNFLYGCNGICQDVYGNGPLPTDIPPAATILTIPPTPTTPASVTTPPTTVATVPPGPISKICLPDFEIAAAWTDYSAKKTYFVSAENLVYVVQNGKLVEDGTPIANDFPGVIWNLPFQAAYFQDDTTYIIDQSLDTYAFKLGIFQSKITGSPTDVAGVAGYGTALGAPAANAGILAVKLNNDILSVNSVTGAPNSDSISAADLVDASGASKVLVTDLNKYTVEEIYSVVDQSATERIAFLYQPTDGRGLQYFDAVPCSSSSLVDANSQVCMTVISGPKSFASTIPGCPPTGTTAGGTGGMVDGGK